MFPREMRTGVVTPAGRGPEPRRRGGPSPRFLLLALLLALAPVAVLGGNRPSEPPPSPLDPPAVPTAREHVALSPPDEAALPPTHRAPACEDRQLTSTDDRTSLTLTGPPRPALLEIVVLAPDGLTPITDAFVELRQAPPPAFEEHVRLVRTEAAGRITVDAGVGDLAVVAWSAHEIGGPLAVEMEEGWNGTVELVLQPAHEVTGRITDATTGAPVAGADVSFWCVSTLDRVLTGADGFFSHPRFAGDAMAQQIRVEAEGFGPTVRYLRVDRSGAWEFPSATPDGVTVARASGTPWVEIELFPELRLQGRVVGTDGRPIATATVSAEGYYHTLPGVASRDGAEGRTNEKGEFFLTALRSDISHSLVIGAPGFAEHYVELEISAGASHDVGAIVLDPELLVAGVIVDQEGQPVEDIAVELEPLPFLPREAESDPLQAAGAANGLDVQVRVQGQLDRRRTCANGTFLFEGVEDRGYLLRVVRDDAPLIERRLQPGDTETATDLLLELPLESLVLVGEVHDAQGPVAGARIEAWRFGAVGTVHTDAEGRFRMAGLDQGAAYRLTAIAGGAEGIVRRVQTSAWAFERPILRLGRAEREGLALVDQ